MRSSIQAVLRKIEAEGAKHDCSVSEHARKWLNLEPLTAALVATLLRISRAQNVLEVGTSTGYSTIWIASVFEESKGRVTTLERDREKQTLAVENISLAGLDRYVDFKLGEATDLVRVLQGLFDCVFFDADRLSAPGQLELLLPKLCRPALLLADNALSHPDEIRSYLNFVNRLPGIDHVIVPVGKGLSIAHLP